MARRIREETVYSDNTILMRDRYIGGVDPVEVRGGRPNINITEEAGDINRTAQLERQWREYEQFQQKAMLFGESNMHYKHQSPTPQEPIRVRQEFDSKALGSEMLDNVIHIKAPGTYRIRAMFRDGKSNWDTMGRDRGSYDIDLTPMDIDYQDDVRDQLKESEKRVEELEAIIAIKEMIL